MGKEKFDAVMTGVRIHWDQEAQVLKFSCADPRGTILIEKCIFVNVDAVPVECWLGEEGGFRFGNGSIGGFFEP